MAKSAKKSTEAATEAPAGNNTLFYIAGAVLAVAIVAGIFYFRDTGPPTGDIDTADLMEPGPLEDIVMGSADAPNIIVEYASMTCPHCAHFHTGVLPELKTKYIDTGKARLVFREFPLDGLALAASMLARCAGEDRYYPMLSGLFETQPNWAVSGADGREKLSFIAKQAGFSQESFDKCLADEELGKKIVEQRQRAQDKFGVNSTPTFFVNGIRLKGGYELDNFEAVLDGGSTEDAPPSG